MRLRSRLGMAGILLSCIAGCVLANRFSYYAPSAGATERSARLQSPRHPSSLEGACDVFVLAGSSFTLRVSFAPDSFPLAIGPDVPVPLPVVPVGILWPWTTGTGQEARLILFMDMDAADTTVTIDFREIALSLPGEKTEMAPLKLVSWNDENDFLRASPEIRRVSRGLRLKYWLYFATPGSSAPGHVTVHLGGLSTSAGPVTIPDIGFDLASDVILQSRRRGGPFGTRPRVLQTAPCASQQSK